MGEANWLLVVAMLGVALPGMALKGFCGDGIEGPAAPASGGTAGWRGTQSVVRVIHKVRWADVGGDPMRGKRWLRSAGLVPGRRWSISLHILAGKRWAEPG